jgi:putative sterol carrier protein
MSRIITAGAALTSPPPAVYGRHVLNGDSFHAEAKEGTMADVTVNGFFEGLAAKLAAKPEKLAGMDCVYQFRVGASAYSVSMKAGKAEVAAGEAATPNCTVTMAESDFLELVTGKLNGQMAFLTGKLKVAGDMGLALKLGSFIG